MGLLKKILKILLPKTTIHRLRREKESSRYRFWRLVWYFKSGFPRKSYYRDPYPNDNTYWVSPNEIHYLTLNEFNYYRDHNKIVSGDWDLPLIRFEENDFYQAYTQRINRKKKWSETEYYKKYLNEIETGENKWGCSNKEEWDQRCTQLDKIYDNIRRKGYSSKKIEDYISVNIGRHGQLLFNDGRHRLTFCKILNISEIPIRITVRHTKWVMFKNQISEYVQSRNGKVYAPINHIDLQNIPSGYGHLRFDLIRKNMKVQPPCNLLDIGAHWGYFCNRFAELGFNCLAVENHPENLFFLKKIKMAEDRQYSLYDDNLFTLDIKNKHFDVVLALSVFHHFTKFENTYHKLVRFLNNLKVKEMFFEPPDPNEPQMQSAYKNFTANKFAKFIIDNSCLQSYSKIGAAEDGRGLYKIN